MWNSAEVNKWYHDREGNDFRDSDPIQVRALKRQLALMSCKRNQYQSYPYTVFETQESAPDFCDHGVQVKREPRKSDQNTQVTSEPKKSADILTCNPFPNNSPMCPTCMYAFGLLKSRVVMKDEELETDFGTRSTDKSAENVQDCVSGTTSLTSPPFSSVALHDYSSECLSDEAYRHHSPKRSGHEVTFLDDYFAQSLPENDMSTSPHQCFCVNNFIDSIRPPLK